MKKAMNKTLKVNRLMVNTEKIRKLENTESWNQLKGHLCGDGWMETRLQVAIKKECRELLNYNAVHLKTTFYTKVS